MLRLALTTVMLLMLNQAVMAEPFTVTDASVERQQALYLLNVSIQYELADELVEALHSGITLPFKVLIEVYRPRRLLPDTEIAFLKQRYDLQYHALSRQYIVTNHNSSVSESFSSLTHALHYLGKINGLPMLDDELLDKDAKYRVRIRAAINNSQLSVPLRLTSYIYGPWSSESTWWDMPL